MHHFPSLVRWVGALLLCLLSVGCSDSHVMPTSGTGDRARQQTGTLRIESVLAKAVPSKVTRLRISGFDTSDRLVFGPIIEAKAAVVVLEEVPIAVVRVQIEYLLDGRIVGIGSSRVAIAPGQVTTLTDPDFLSLEEELISLAVSPANASIPRGTSQQLTVTGTFSDQSQVDLSTVALWSSSNPEVAAVSESGLALALAFGSTTLTATLSGVTGSATLNVTDAVVSTITIAPLSPSMAAGTTLPFTITGNFSDGTSQDLTGQVALSSSNTAVATIDPVSGIATAITAGQSAITASFQGITASTTLTVSDATLLGIAVTPTETTLPRGLTRQFTATGTFSDGSQQDLSSVVLWSSSAPATASIDSAGLVRSGVPGTVVITATLRDVEGRTSLRVTSAVMVGLTVLPGQPSIFQGGTQAFTAEATYSDRTKVTVPAAWSSSAPTVASIDPITGLAEAGNETGTTTISATAHGFTATTTLTIALNSITSIAIDPPVALSAPGATRQYRAIATRMDGTTEEVTDQVAWSSNDTDVTIANDNTGANTIGRAVVAAGADVGQTVTITATLDSFTPATSTLTLNLFVYVAEQSGSRVRRFQTASGALVTPETFSVAPGPLCIAVHPTGRYAYVGSSRGLVQTFEIDPSHGDLTEVGTGISTGASGRRTAITVHPNGRYAYVANFDNNTATMYTIDPESGALGGGTSMATGQIPKGIAVDPSGRFLYVANSTTGDVSAYTINESNGTLQESAGPRFPAGNGAESVTTHPNGRFAYVTNGIGESISSYDIDSSTGALTLVDTADLTTLGNPQALVVDPSGSRAYVVTRPPHALHSFAIAADGRLTPLQSASIANDGPEALAIDPSGRYLYTGNFQSNTVSMFTSAAGVLTAGATGTTSGWAIGVATTP